MIAAPRTGSSNTPSRRRTRIIWSNRAPGSSAPVRSSAPRWDPCSARISAPGCSSAAWCAPERSAPRALLKPGCFEGGLSIVTEVAELQQLALAECPQMPDVRLDLGSASTASSTSADQGGHLVAGVEQLLRVPDGPVVPRLTQPAQERKRLLAASDDTRLDEPAGEVDCELGESQIVERVPVAPAERDVDASHDLDVLFRHRTQYRLRAAAA